MPPAHHETLQCPRCQGKLQVAADGLVCVQNCGEWLDERGLHGLALDQIGGPDTRRRADPIATCARCRRVMKPRSWGAALYDVCPAHGIWIDDWYRVAFRMRLAEALDHKRDVDRRAAEEASEAAAIDELAAKLADNTDEARRALARRVIAIERRLDKLEKKPR
ncbi:MAG TPA: hypothetical protein VFQ53_38505 [Kofleriaceae bacterium]|nr:hypothetical protein [Kofleriaceae bacterium]